MRMYEPTYEDVRQLLAARTTVSSRFGRMLDIMREGRGGGAGSAVAKAVQEHDEVQRLKDAAVFRCVDDLYNYPNMKWSIMPDLHKFAERNKLRDGEAVVRILYAFEAWSTHWPEQGLADVYAWLRSLDRSLPPILCENDESPAQSFRSGHSPRARAKASSVVADAHVALHAWVGMWKRRTDGMRRAG